MKKIVLFLTAIVVLFAAFLCVTYFLDHTLPDYDNQVRKENVITQQYPPEMIDRLAEKIERKKLRYSDLRRQFRMECVRKTHEGYYIVLSQTKGGNTFVFLDDHLYVTGLLTSEHFYSKEEFERLLFVDQDTTQEDVRSKDPNTFPSPVSSVPQSVHIVQEGVVVVTYRRFDENGKQYDIPRVDYMNFYSNAELVSPPKYCAAFSAPYILEIDKMN